MKKIYFVTGNQFKISSAKKMLDDLVEVEQYKMDLIEPQSNDQLYISHYKLDQAFKTLQKPVMVEDLGYYIEKYNQFPGILTKFILEGIGIDGIIKLINEGDKAFFRGTISYKDDKNTFDVEHVMKGYLTKKYDKEKFNPKTPFKSIFIPEGYDKPIAELPENIVNNLSYMNQVYKDFKDKLIKLKI